MEKSRYGFTLIEILVVIGILAIIMAIVLVAINPKRQFDLAKDTERKSNLTEIRKSLIQYFLDNKTYPSSSQWSAISCGSTANTNMQPYIAAIPCDPDTDTKYYYEPLDADCQLCPENSRCTGFRIYAKLINENDLAIRQSGCDPIIGCGFTAPSGEIPNYYLTSNCYFEVSAQVTPSGFTPTATPDPNISVTPTGVPSASVTPDLTASPTVVSPTLTPANPSSSPTPTISVNITVIPGYTPNAAFDADRVIDVQQIALALEKYKFLNGAYPDCGTSWQDVPTCLTVYLSTLLNLGALPPDPENGDPYIYIKYAGGYCLGSHLGDPASRTSEINCPVGAPNGAYAYRIKERNEIIYRPIPNPLSEITKDQRDAQRKTDLETFTDAMEQYKLDYGHYPNCWIDPYVWATTGSGDFFCGGQFTSYSTSYNFDPGGVNSYVIVQWDPGPDGYFRQYCFGAYTDKGDNANCLLGCPVNNYDANYCYFSKNP